MSLHLYETFRGSKSHDSVCAQFFCTLNIQLGDDLKISKDAMSKFYHNLLMQTLRKPKHKITVNFIKISYLVININNFLQNKTCNFKKIDQETKQHTLKLLKTIAFCWKNLKCIIF